MSEESHNARALLAWLLSLVAEAAGAGQPAPRGAVLGGVGNAMGWYGVQGEGFVGSGRACLFLGAGVPWTEETVVAGAIGGRAFTRGGRHRGFLELSLSMISGSSINGGEWHANYGPGVAAGYRFTTDGGFTLMISAGAGRAQHSTEPTGGLALGYTWRRRTP